MKRLDTRKKLREKMDALVLKVVEEAEKLGAAKSDERLDVMKHVTAYLSVMNRTPEEPEGAEIHAFRERLSRSVAGRGGDGDNSDSDADQADGDDEPGDDPPESDVGTFPRAVP